MRVLMQKRETVEVEIDLTDKGLEEVARLYEQFQSGDYGPMDPERIDVTFEVAVDDVTDVQSALLQRAIDIEKAHRGDS